MAKPQDSLTLHLPPLLLTVEQVAALLGVAPNSVWKRHGSGLLGPMPVHLGRTVRWRSAELERWVAANCPPRSAWIETEKESRGNP